METENEHHQIIRDNLQRITNDVIVEMRHYCKTVQYFIDHQQRLNQEIFSMKPPETEKEKYIYTENVTEIANKIKYINITPSNNFCCILFIIKCIMT